MNDATLTWTKSLTGTPTSYSVVWTQNGVALPAVPTPVSASSDVTGYSQDFATANPTVTLAPGDVVGATITAVDATNNLSSAATPSVPATVTLPVSPVAPGVPQNVVLALS